MNAEEKLKQLKDEGKTVYSFSRLGTKETCDWEYHNTYNLKDRGKDNIYTIMGSCIHDNIEGIYKGENDIEKFRSSYKDKLIELEMLGYDFPSEKIGESWKSDVGHFLKHFNKIDKKMALEKLIVFNVVDDIWMQGYVDAIAPSDKGKPYVNIIDWKSSSKFSGKKLTEAGRQLVMYKLGLEATTDFKVDKVMWFMIKYVYVCTMQKNGKVRKKMCNRGKWVKEIKSQVEKALHELNIDEFELELLLDKAIEENDLSCLPEEVQQKWWLEDCFVEYEVNDDVVEELKQYVRDKVNEIESKDPDNAEEWSPIEITNKNSFYCSVLCGHKQNCPAYKQYLKENADGFEKKDKKVDVFDIFG